MSQQISATARLADNTSLSNTANLLRFRQLEKLLSFELLGLQRLALDCVGYAMLMTPNKADAAVHG